MELFYNLLTTGTILLIVISLIYRLLWPEMEKQYHSLGKHRLKLTSTGLLFIILIVCWPIWVSLSTPVFILSWIASGWTICMVAYVSFMKILYPEMMFMQQFGLYKKRAKIRIVLITSSVISWSMYFIGVTFT